MDEDEDDGDDYDDDDFSVHLLEHANLENNRQLEVQPYRMEEMKISFFLQLTKDSNPN